ncbi:MAG: hypothetical protein F4158_02940, partial [Synechococcus sp. SB0675_bin_7]|nr:hypothetical protein [Synechococcus sp. SB0675_bin_7]
MATAHGDYNWPMFSDEYRNYQDCLQGDGTGKGACTHDLHSGALRAGSNIYNIGTWNDGVDEPDGTLTAVVEYEKAGETVTSNSVTLSIRDNDPTVVSLVRTGTVSTVAFTVTLSRALVAGEVIDVPLVVSGAGVSADDYTLSLTSGTGATLSGTATLTPTLRFSGAGAQEAMLKLVPAAGSTVERYTIALGPDGDGANGFDHAGLGTNVGGGADPHGTRNSFDVKRGAMEPSVSITGGPDVTEGSTATFTVTASPAPSTPVTVMVDVTDSGSFAGDGQAGSRSVTVGVDGTGSLTVTTVNDGIDDWEGAITATVQVGDGYTVSAPSSAAVAVLNDGVQLPDFNLRLNYSTDPSGITEGGRFFFVVSPSTWVKKYVPVTLKITHTGDFTPRGKLWAITGSHNGVYGPWLFYTRTKNDDMDEPDGTVTAIAEYGNGRTSNSVTLPIIDNDPTVVSLSRTGAGAVSAGSGVAFTVSLGRALVAGEVIDVPLAVSGAGVSVDDYTLSVTGGTGAALSGTDTLMPTLRFSGAGAQTATLELVPAASSVGKQYHIALGPDGDSANGFDRSGLGTNVGGGADPHGTRNSFDVEVTPAQQQLFQQHGEPTAPEVGI